MKSKKVLFLTQAAMIAALYVVLTELSNVFGLASYAVQIRFSEALTILPFFTPAAIPGLFVGCIISNLLVSANVFDILFGSLATLLGALGTYGIKKLFTKKHPVSNHVQSQFVESKKSNKTAVWLAPIPPIVSNTIIIPLVLKYAYGIEPLWFSFITVFAGEFISCGIMGIFLLIFLKKYQRHIFKI